MATTSDIIDGALRNLKVLDALNSASAEDAALALEKLNDMMHAWALKGVDINHYDLQLTSPFSLDDKHVRGVKALLAVELAADMGKDPSPAVLSVADAGWRGLLDEYLMPDEVGVDDALRRIPITRYLGEDG